MASSRDSSGRFTASGAGAVVRFKPDPKGMAEFMRSPSGPVLRDLLRRADQLIGLAKQQVGVGSSPAKGSILGAGGNPQPHLRDTIVKRTDMSRPEGPVVMVGSDAAPKALIHHEGSRPHVIMPRRATMLRFVGRTGQVVFARKVNHPGTKPNRYLSDNLPKVVK